MSSIPTTSLFSPTPSFNFILNNDIESQENKPDSSLPPTPEKVIVWKPEKKDDGTIKFIPSPVKQQLRDIKDNCIYQFKNEADGSKYIGSSLKTGNTDIVRRLQKYGRAINKESKSDKSNLTPDFTSDKKPKKQRSFRPIEKALRRTPTQFTCSVIQIYPMTTEEELKEVEEKWITNYRTISPSKGYNRRMPTTEAHRSGPRLTNRKLFDEAENKNDKLKNNSTSDKIFIS